MKIPDYNLAEADAALAPEIRALVNSSYKELSDMGLNYTATYQDVETTLTSS